METLSADQLAGATVLKDTPAPVAETPASTPAQPAPSDVPTSNAVPSDYAGPVKNTSSGLIDVVPMHGQSDTLQNMVTGAKTIANELSPVRSDLSVHVPMSGMLDPAKRRELERGVSDVVTFGRAQKLGEWVDPKFADTAQPDAAAAPGYREGGALAGMALPNPATEIAAPLVKGGVKLAGKAIEKIGAGAEERGIQRGVEDIAEGASKKARAGLQKSASKIDSLAHDYPELVKFSKDDPKLVESAAKIRQGAGEKLSELYAEKDAESAAIPEHAADADTTPMSAVPKPVEGEPTTKIQPERAGGVEFSAPLKNMNDSIARLKGGDTGQRAVAEQLEKIRDNLSSRPDVKGDPFATIPAEELRAEQSHFQRIGYSKAVPGMQGYAEASAQIEAARQASKDIGDAVVRHVTGMDYAEAAKVAASAPSSLAAKLFKLNGEVEGANRIEAAVASRAGRTKDGLADFMRFIGHNKHAGALGVASMVAHGAGLHTVGHVLEGAAGAVAAAPTVARYGDKALAALARAKIAGDQAGMAQIASKMIDAGATAAVIHHVLSNPEKYEHNDREGVAP